MSLNKNKHKHYQKFSPDKPQPSLRPNNKSKSDFVSLSKVQLNQRPPKSKESSIKAPALPNTKKIRSPSIDTNIIKKSSFDGTKDKQNPLLHKEASRPSKKEISSAKFLDKRPGISDSNSVKTKNSNQIAHKSTTTTVFSKVPFSKNSYNYNSRNSFNKNSVPNNSRPKDGSSVVISTKESPRHFPKNNSPQRSGKHGVAPSNFSNKLHNNPHQTKYSAPITNNKKQERGDWPNQKLPRHFNNNNSKPYVDRSKTATSNFRSHSSNVPSGKHYSNTNNNKFPKLSYPVLFTPLKKMPRSLLVPVGVCKRSSRWWLRRYLMTSFRFPRTASASWFFTTRPRPLKKILKKIISFWIKRRRLTKYTFFKKPKTKKSRRRLRRRFRDLLHILSLADFPWRSFPVNFVKKWVEVSLSPKSKFRKIKPSFYSSTDVKLSVKAQLSRRFQWKDPALKYSEESRKRFLQKMLDRTPGLRLSTSLSEVNEWRRRHLLFERRRFVQPLHLENPIFAQFFLAHLYSNFFVNPDFKYVARTNRWARYSAINYMRQQLVRVRSLASLRDRSGLRQYVRALFIITKRKRWDLLKWRKFRRNWKKFRRLALSNRPLDFPGPGERSHWPSPIIRQQVISTASFAALATLKANKIGRRIKNCQFKFLNLNKILRKSLAFLNRRLHLWYLRSFGPILLDLIPRLPKFLMPSTFPATFRYTLGIFFTASWTLRDQDLLREGYYNDSVASIAPLIASFWPDLIFNVFFKNWTNVNSKSFSFIFFSHFVERESLFWRRFFNFFRYSKDDFVFKNSPSIQPFSRYYKLYFEHPLWFLLQANRLLLLLPFVTKRVRQRFFFNFRVLLNWARSPSALKKVSQEPSRAMDRLFWWFNKQTNYGLRLRQKYRSGARTQVVKWLRQCLLIHRFSASTGHLSRLRLRFGFTFFFKFLSLVFQRRWKGLTCPPALINHRRNEFLLGLAKKTKKFRYFFKGTSFFKWRPWKKRKKFSLNSFNKAKLFKKPNFKFNKAKFPQNKNVPLAKVLKKRKPKKVNWTLVQHRPKFSTVHFLHVYRGAFLWDLVLIWSLIFTQNLRNFFIKSIHWLSTFFTFSESTNKIHAMLTLPLIYRSLLPSSHYSFFRMACLCWPTNNFLRRRNRRSRFHQIFSSFFYRSRKMQRPLIPHFYRRFNYIRRLPFKKFRAFWTHPANFVSRGQMVPLSIRFGRRDKLSPRFSMKRPVALMVSSNKPLYQWSLI